MLKDIKEYVLKRKEELKKEISTFKTSPRLTIYQFNDLESSNRYVRNKVKDCEEVGIITNVVKCSVYDSEYLYFYDSIQDYINFSGDSIIIQQPIDKSFKGTLIENLTIPDNVDVDGFNNYSWFKPATPKGIIDYLDYCGFKFESNRAVVIGRSNIVGKPMAQMLLDRNMTVTICHSHTPMDEIYDYCINSELVVCAVGKSNFLDCSMLKYDDVYPIVIDVGINFDENGKLVGDCCNKYNDCSPVPGGCGLLTRLALLENVVESYKIRKGIK